MVHENILHKIPLLQLRARRLLIGQYKGQHVQRSRNSQADFEQLREYCVGDDIRFIDWKSSARGQKMVVRTYQEERDRTVLLVVDISRSSTFGSTECTKERVVRECAALIACAAAHARDRVGLVLFHEKVHTVIPPGSKAEHAIALVHALLETPFGGLNTAFDEAVQAALLLAPKKRSLMIIVSDCMSDAVTKALPLAAAMHDVVIIRAQDTVERDIPQSLCMKFQDIETGEIFDINSKYQMDALQNFIMQWTREQDSFFQKHAIDHVTISANPGFDETLIHFFNTRVRR